MPKKSSTSRTLCSSFRARSQCEAQGRSPGQLGRGRFESSSAVSGAGSNPILSRLRGSGVIPLLVARKLSLLTNYSSGTGENGLKMNARCLLIDIDADYMLDRRLPLSKQRGRPGKRWISAGQILCLFQSRGLSVVHEIRYCKDHSEAYDFWRSINAHNCICIHVDAHSDMYGSSIEPERLLSVGYKPVAGNYLRFALASGIVSKLILVPPDWYPLSCYLAEELLRYGYHNDPRINVRHLAEIKVPPASLIIVTIATSPQYTPSWIDGEAKKLFRLFNSIKYGRDHA